MKKYLILISSTILLFSCEKNTDSLIIQNQDNTDEVSILSSDNFNANNVKLKLDLDAEELRKEYSKPRSQWPKPNLDQGIEHNEIGNLEPVKNTKYTKSKYDLGKMLFSESKLSSSSTMSCQSCHNSRFGWADGIKTPMGLDAQLLKRNSPTIVNTAHNKTLFWDSRASNLEEQAKMVLLNPKEMDSSEELVVANLSNNPIYKNLFKQSFGDEKITLDRISQAIAVFERTIVTKNKSLFDQFVMGNNKALSDSQIRGLHIFRTSGRCMNCHNGSNFTDNKMHNIGLVLEGTKYEDTGRYDITKKDSDYGLFKTPSLRNISKTAPYIHNGLIINLKGMINMYSNGMPNSRNKSPHIRPLGLQMNDREDLISFLESLTEDIQE